MKPRRVVVMLELYTDIPLADLKQKTRWRFLMKRAMTQTFKVLENPKPNVVGK